MHPVAAPDASYKMMQCCNCPAKFRYPITRSNNYSKLCPTCRESRTAANKKRFDGRRGTPTSPIKDREVYEALCNIPDYVMHPVRIVDAAIRQCGG